MADRNLQEQLAHLKTAGYSKILVAVDDKDITLKVFKKALELAKTFRSQLIIFHCLQKPLAPQSDSLVYAAMSGYSGIYSSPETLALEDHLLKEIEEETQSWLSAFVRRATEEGIKCEAYYQFGEAGVQICHTAKNWGADLIVIGRRGRQGLSELFLGSVSNYVVHNASCCVLVVQTD